MFSDDLQISVLDLFRSVPQTLALAREADGLALRRFWLTEHQPQPSPLSVLPLLAVTTQRIRVGTAGILMRYYSPPRTA